MFFHTFYPYINLFSPKYNLFTPIQRIKPFKTSKEGCGGMIFQVNIAPLNIPLFIFRQDGLMYKFKAPTRATNIRGDQEEKIVFKIIETSGNLGNIVK